MSEPYEEWVEGERLLRFPPGRRHEEVCRQLHRRVALALAELNTVQKLDPRTQFKFSPGNVIRPDLALVTQANSKLWLAAEVISSDDHSADTVTKKTIYQEMRIPRLWMIDLRYDNVEIYHGSQYGLTLKQILGGRELLMESLLPGFQLPVHELFSGSLGTKEGRYDF